MSQTIPAPESEQKPKRHFLMHPAVLITEAVLLAGVAFAIYQSTAVPEDHFTGIATVEHVNGGGKKCWVDLRTEDGVFLNDFRMSQDTCKQVSEGDVVEVVKGKYVPEIASKY